jgi:hypothetical protein
VVKFKYALTASGKYNALREKYLKLMDCLNAEGSLKGNRDY